MMAQALLLTHVVPSDRLEVSMGAAAVPAVCCRAHDAHAHALY